MRWETLISSNQHGDALAAYEMLTVASEQLVRTPETARRTAAGRGVAPARHVVIGA